MYHILWWPSPPVGVEPDRQDRDIAEVCRLTSHQAVVLLTVVAVIVAAARLFGALAQRLGQPAVVGEMVFGLLIGPWVLGGAVLQGSTSSNVSALADLGLAVFMFLVGLDVDTGVVREAGRISWTVAVGGTAVAFGLGVAVATLMASRHAPAGTTPFLLFMGLAMSITAFPVLARILDDFGLSATPVGAVALAAAAICDVAAWTMLAVLSAATGVQGAENAWRVLLLIPYVAVMVLVVGPVLRRIVDRHSEGLPPSVAATLLAGLLISAAATEALGLHFIFGAFLFGLIVPRGTRARVRAWARTSLQPVTTSLLLPLYFVMAGLSVRLHGLRAADVGCLVLVIAAAFVGKFGGTLVAARTQRVAPRQAMVLATLMTTRGLTELVVLGVGLQAGLLDRTAYSVMVIMALVTTAAAGPMLRLLLGGQTAAAQERMSLPAASAE
jgi:Kef-type K+ transport system membrane component KefB